MKQLEVQIMGQSYLLASPDGGESRLLDAVERVDTAMNKIRDAGKVRARERIAVLAALNIAFEQADRPPVEPPIAAAVAAQVPGASSTVAEPPDGTMLSALLQRLDHALGDDGRLL
jgi:cell division protein ZapA